MKSLTLTLNLDHNVSNFPISLSVVLFGLSFYEIPINLVNERVRVGREYVSSVLYAELC